MVEKEEQRKQNIKLNLSRTKKADNLVRLKKKINENSNNNLDSTLVGKEM